jgi:hypothetical protein
MTSETVHGYIATNCTKVSDILSLDQDEYIERIVVPFYDFDKLIMSEMCRGNIIEPKMLAMMYAWKNLYEKLTKKCPDRIARSGTFVGFLKSHNTPNGDI